MFLYFQDVVIINGNGIFINPLHIKIQYSAVLVPPPALISHCDQENFTLANYTEFYDIICMGTGYSTMIFLGRKKTDPEIMGTSRYSYSLCTTAQYSTARYSYSRYA